MPTRNVKARFGLDEVGGPRSPFERGDKSHVTTHSRKWEDYEDTSGGDEDGESDASVNELETREKRQKLEQRLKELRKMGSGGQAQKPTLEQFKATLEKSGYKSYTNGHILKQADYSKYESI